MLPHIIAQIKIMNNQLHRPFKVKVYQTTFVVDDHEPRTREEILAVDPQARFLPDGPSCWEPRDGEEQRRLWNGECNMGPNGAVFDDDSADVLADYRGNLYVVTAVVKQEQYDGGVLRIDDLFSRAIRWAPKHFERLIIVEVRKKGNAIRRVLKRFTRAE